MSEEKIVSVVREFVEAYVKRDVEKMLSFFAEDTLWVDPMGTFKGKEELKRYLAWDVQTVPELKIRDAGIGIMVSGNKAVCEWVFDGSTSDGRRWRDIPVITVYEFSGGKIQQQHRAYRQAIDE